MKNIFDNDRSWYVLFGLIVLSALAYTIRQNYVGEANLRKYGVVIMAGVYRNQYVKGTNNFSVNYWYEGKLYDNSCRSSRVDRAVGDSLRIGLTQKG